jgi:hypothetical protein
LDEAVVVAERSVSVNYKHTQTGGWLRSAAVLPAPALFLVGLAVGKALLFFFGATALAGVGWVFSSMTIEVTPAELIWFFGPGVWRKTLARTDIIGVTVARNKWWWGWGIHLTPHGWLYNVAGLDAVEIALKNGRTLRLGSDEPAKLVRILADG